MDGALDDLRVLDLTGDLGMYAGKLLADLGADVIKIEPPEGDPGRKRGPFYHDVPNPERSLHHFFHNTGKRGVTLDLTSDEGGALFLRLVETADIVIESARPGWMADQGLGFALLRERRPGLILVSVTPFGQTGPYAQYRGDDIVGAAMGGLMYISGSETSPPSQPGGERGLLSEQQAAVVAAVGALFALAARDRNGKGQWVDVSMQEAVGIANDNALGYLDVMGQVRRRRGGITGSTGRKNIHPCADGWVVGGAGGRWAAFQGWLEQQGLLSERWRDERWNDPDYRAANADELEVVLEELLLGLTRAEIYAEGQRRRMPLAPVRTLDEVFADHVLHEREFFVDLLHPDLDQVITVPGAPYKLSETPWRVARPAPTIGQHNEEVFGALGIGTEELGRLRNVGVV